MMSKASGSDDFSSSSQSSGAERGRLSLPSTSRNGAVPQHKQRRLSSRPPAAEEEGEEPEAAGEKPRRLESAEGSGDERSRRIIRNQYRELICSVQRKAGVRLPSGAALPAVRGPRAVPGPGAGPALLRRGGCFFVPGKWGLRVGSPSDAMLVAGP